MLSTADFETTTNENDCRVWAWAVCEIGNTDNFTYGNTIESFFEYIETNENSTTEKFKLWIKDHNNEFGVFVRITYITKTEEIVNIDFQETSR